MTFSAYAAARTYEGKYGACDLWYMMLATCATWSVAIRVNTKRIIADRMSAILMPAGMSEG